MFYVNFFKIITISFLLLSCSQANEGFIDGITAGIMVEPDIKKMHKKKFPN